MEEELSEREREILRLVATGASNKQIAHQLSISTNTVKVHLRNIFAKIGVASRTEATLYAIREGLVQVGEQPVEAAVGESLPIQRPEARGWPVSRRASGWLLATAALVVGGVILLVTSGSLAGEAHKPVVLPTATGAPPAPTPARWQGRAPLPTARSGLAVATYENQIYAIAGETEQGPTTVVERYTPALDKWTAVAAKPVPVADVGAAVIGGEIYVPGGRLPSGEVTNVLEVYHPREDRWEQRAPLPVGLSAYALAAFEGKLYLFGGWDGSRYVAAVYEYDPRQDAWHLRSAMPTERGYAGAAVAGGRIYVVGGYNGAQALSTNEEYLPEQDAAGNPWQKRAPLPRGRYGMGVTSIADIIYVLGGVGEAGEQPLAYLPQRDEWQPFDPPPSSPREWAYPGLIPLGSYLYAVGGRVDGTPTGQHTAYQAIYTIVVPFLR